MPAEHNDGRIYAAPGPMEEHFPQLDPLNMFNAGVGKTSPRKRWA